LLSRLRGPQPLRPRLAAPILVTITSIFVTMTSAPSPVGYS